MTVGNDAAPPDAPQMLDLLGVDAVQVLIGDHGKRLWVCTTEHGTVLRVKAERITLEDRRHDTRSILRDALAEAYGAGVRAQIRFMETFLDGQVPNPETWVDDYLLRKGVQ